jgi:hypothetical protein
MEKKRLVVFTRYPEPGKTKTRLIPALGPEGAAAVQQRMTRYTLDSARTIAKELSVAVEVRFAGGDSEKMAACFGSDLAYRPQGHGDLGCRMMCAFRDAFEEGAEQVAIIGTDCPDLTAETIGDAFKKLATRDLVLGPANDGGYYLIASRSAIPQLFDAIPWGVEEVLDETVRRAQSLGLSTDLLRRLSDVDRPEDLPVWYRAEQSRSRVESLRISVIIPTLNEAACLPATLQSLRQSENTQIIVVDGGSSDCTCDIAHAAGCIVLKHQRGRAVQINAGAEAADGEILLLLHADTCVPSGFDEAIRSTLSNPKVAAGAFRLRIDASGWPLRLIERAVEVRSRLFQMPYGDQGIFLRTSLFRKLGKMPRLPIMEDFELVRSLRKGGKIEILPCNAVTSGRRWKTVGPWKTTLINQCVILGYYLGIAPERLAEWYQRRPPSDTFCKPGRGVPVEKPDANHKAW